MKLEAKFETGEVVITIPVECSRNAYNDDYYYVMERIAKGIGMEYLYSDIVEDSNE